MAMHAITFVYVLKSLSQVDRHYVGLSADPDKRLRQHNEGKVRSTKGYRPWKIIYTEEYSTRSEAYARERYFKGIEGHYHLKKLLMAKGLW
jgi:putative endonuclease